MTDVTPFMGMWTEFLETGDSCSGSFHSLKLWICLTMPFRSSAVRCPNFLWPRNWSWFGLWTLTFMICLMEESYNPEKKTFNWIIKGYPLTVCVCVPESRSHTPNGNLNHLCVFTSATILKSSQTSLTFWILRKLNIYLYIYFFVGERHKINLFRLLFQMK